jgi:Zn-dependent alcohol dehydrogenase
VFVTVKAAIPHMIAAGSLDAMVTRTYPLEEINQGYQDLRDGKNIRGVLVM